MRMKGIGLNLMVIPIFVVLSIIAKTCFIYTVAGSFLIGVGIAMYVGGE